MSNPPSNDNEPVFDKAHEPKQEKNHRLATQLACVIVVCICILFLRSEFNESEKRPTRPLIAGWDDLLPCSYTVSFDGAKQLELFEDRGATLWAVKDDKIDKIAAGQWSFDEISKRYTIAVDGLTDSYSIVSLPIASAFSCTLMMGTIDSTDLRTSWFSIPNDPGDDRERY